ncbi:MAG: methyltransferase domain-containing protein [Ruminococcaceae bacterium]|nr:methyltransferase domain-containing protein [Oscillospiraceae bacterium]
MENPVPFWEDAYRSDNVMAFPIEPNKTVVEYEHLLDKNAAILEVGCGEGQNVLYLAKRGFCNIDAFDISVAGIGKLKRLCEVNGVNINAMVRDLADYTFDKKYDLIMSFATLCFVEKRVWRQFIADAKDNTNIGGIHIMHIFTDEVPASPDIAPFAVGLAHDGEIKELYDSWEILSFQSYTFEDEHPGVPKHLHSVNKIVARKT